MMFFYLCIFQLLLFISQFSQGDASKLISVQDHNVHKKVQFKLHSQDTIGHVVLTPGVKNGFLKQRLNQRIKIIIHGYLETADTATSKKIREKFLPQSNVTLISVDWGKASRYPNYWPVQKNVQVVGRYVGEMVDWLVQEGADPKKIHIIGHSLGAHVAGFAGASLRPGRRVARITGLDPALPGFDGAKPEDRLDTTDADFVDVIHTSDGLYGYPLPMGHADFFVNGGRHRQPGCPVIDLGVCSHIRSVDYFMESVDPRHKFEAALCPEIPRKGPAGCKWSPYFMGYHLQPSARGLFYVQTSSKYPFALIN